MSRILILGWGNPLRGDDAFGWRAAEALARDCNNSEIIIRASHQLLPEYAEEISRSDLVIFIDASCDNDPPGEIRSVRVEPRSSPSASFSHQLDPPALLGMAQELYGFCPEARFFLAGLRSFEYGEGLSAEAESALRIVLERIRGICGASLSDAPAHGNSRKANVETEDPGR